MRGKPGTQESNLPKEHAKGPDGKPLCKARARKYGHLLSAYDYETTCKACSKLLEDKKLDNK